MKSTIQKNLQHLRGLMADNQFDAYIVPAADPHQSEYVDAHWKCREWISGFTGSAGTAAILRETAGLWTDGRYFIQAEQQLEGSG
ncbi:MAG: aminopeptidase P family N-terminal domain-containing protein, partial [Verrucomicrobia bacterium]|nr:aminopeptidase P family N-terminal domain-containing protein [Verrucomicrobiota bacterium]